jgi:polyferredoxin
MMAFFVPVTIAGFMGPQARDSSVTLNLFWDWWWPGYLFLFVFIGRLWCAVCPFMITAEWIRRFSFWLFPRQQLPWNTQWLNRWGAWILSLFYHFKLRKSKMEVVLLFKSTNHVCSKRSPSNHWFCGRIL